MPVPTLSIATAPMRTGGALPLVIFIFTTCGMGDAAVGMLIAAATCAVYALLLGFPMLRLRGHYFAISTLTFAIATQQLIKNLDFLGGTSGISHHRTRSVGAP